MSGMQNNREFPTWMCDVKYQENDLVIKDGVVCKYWRYPKSGELVWLSADNCHQYDMFILTDKEGS